MFLSTLRGSEHLERCEYTANHQTHARKLTQNMNPAEELENEPLIENQSSEGQKHKIPRMWVWLLREFCLRLISEGAGCIPDVFYGAALRCFRI